MNGLIVHAISEYISGEGRVETVDAFFEEAQQRYHVVLDKLADM